KSYAAIIPMTVKRIKMGIPPIIYGDGSKTRDFTAVEDVVRGAIAVMEKGKTGEIYNICSSRETTVLEMMDMIANELGYKGCYQFSDERQGDVTRHLGCNRKAMIELGWSPEIGLREAVRRAIREY
ncbi:MAG: NAD-dependent epimerase/dehydratase family protein, partial [Chloroflexi bacterium]|nr:NAD-dependent epimerase/dehydratase family protein [Chloroflexota bacterium]